MKYFLRKINGLKEMFFFDNYLQIIINQLFFPWHPIFIYRKYKYFILVDKSKGDVNGVRNVITSPMYGSLLVHCNINQPLRLMDLGANAGGFPLLLLIKGLSIAQYIGVEMSPFAFTRLFYNINTNLENTKVQLIQKSIFPTSGEIEVYLSEGSTGDSIFNEISLQEKKSLIKIKTTTFDEVAAHFGDNQIDICKIDIESAEYALFDSQETCQLLKNVKNIIIEIHQTTGHSSSALVDKIINFGFTLKMRNEDVFLFQRINQ